MSLLRNSFPEYIVQCFIVSGLDDIDTILKMSTESESNSIDVIEQYIDEVKNEFPQCCSTSISTHRPFKLPLGHIIKITSFINRIHNEFGKKSHKAKKVPALKRSKYAKTKNVTVNKEQSNDDTEQDDI